MRPPLLATLTFAEVGGVPDRIIDLPPLPAETTLLPTLPHNASYLVEYTPVVAGKYYPVVTIAGGEVSTDMTAGVAVTSANASAVSSTFDSNLVRKDGGLHMEHISFVHAECIHV